MEDQMNRKYRTLFHIDLCAGKRHLALCLSALTLLSPLGRNFASGQTTVGASAGSELSGPLVMLPKYQARAPRKCSSVTKPPSVSEAAVMVQCSMDGLGDTGVTLTQDVKIEMGVSRPFVYRTDAGLAGVDLDAQVSPLRGSYTVYFCRSIGVGVPAGHSCIKTAMQESHGWCWKTSFGDYKCKMHPTTPIMEQGMPAPTTY
jgi:hypothetical protein